jgi:tetratricopeptide (TPR) repeat protein
MGRNEDRIRKTFLGAAVLLVWLGTGTEAATASTDPCHGQPPSAPVVCIDHEDPKEVFVRLPNGTTRRPHEGSVAVPTGKDISVVVFDTQTALFTYEASTSPIELKTLEELQKFTGSFGSYLLEAATRASGGPKAVTDPLARAGEVPQPCGGWSSAQRQEWTAGVTEARSLLERLTPLEASRGKLADALREVQQILFWARRYAETIEDDEPVGRSQLQQAFSDGRLQSYEELIAAYEKLEELRSTIDEARSMIDRLRDTAERLNHPQECAGSAGYLGTLAGVLETSVEEYDKLIADREKVLQEAAAIEAFGWKLLQSKDFWKSPKPVEVDFDTGQKLNVVVKRSGDARLARARSNKKPFELTLKILPDNVVRPAVSLALLHTDKAVFPEFGTEKKDDGQFEIIEKDLSDRRVAYALGLSLTFRGLDSRDRGGDWVYWPVELYLNPSDDDRALGVGQGISWKALKLSAGVMWTRHKKLAEDLALGDLLAAEGGLKTEDSYGSPEVYVGISITGWAPFKK